MYNPFARRKGFIPLRRRKITAVPPPEEIVVIPWSYGITKKHNWEYPDADLLVVVGEEHTYVIDAETGEIQNTFDFNSYYLEPAGLIGNQLYLVKSYYDSDADRSTLTISIYNIEDGSTISSDAFEIDGNVYFNEWVSDCAINVDGYIYFMFGRAYYDNDEWKIRSYIAVYHPNEGLRYREWGLLTTYCGGIEINDDGSATYYAYDRYIGRYLWLKVDKDLSILDIDEFGVGKIIPTINDHDILCSGGATSGSLTYGDQEICSFNAPSGYYFFGRCAAIGDTWDFVVLAYDSYYCAMSETYRVVSVEAATCGDSLCCTHVFDPGYTWDWYSSDRTICASTVDSLIILYSNEGGGKVVSMYGDVLLEGIGGTRFIPVLTNSKGYFYPCGGEWVKCYNTNLELEWQTSILPDYVSHCFIVMYD